ncbi:TVP38/TMEM64 family protein [Phycicoccus sonneratiae]|uniref:TVP38/TMEM64 family membrane protein n=1 Tax=Phycicoccus sonneratiae TaxID=2807628 RepID=A0ABS2CPD3_9MICO|nr:VTT domain-containing protein [Phycicoccus sonneraticus]MBM6401737.1 TVP38/TMEM64 family protein [Phycicoccus sonneraticus]
MATSGPLRVRLLAAAIALALGAGLVVLVLGGDLDTVRRAVAGSGPWGPLVYVLLHVLVTLVPVPKNLLAGIAGALFGLGAGTALSWVASMLSAWVTFEIAGRLGRDAVSALTGTRVERVRRVLREQGVLAVVIARLTPLVPFTVVNYGAGVSPVSRRDYLLGTAVGVLPGTVAYVAVGASAGRDATTILLAGGAGVLLLVAAALVTRRLRRR